MKILDVIIAKGVDFFKAKSPKLFVAIAAGAGYLNVLCSQTIAYWKEMAIVNPQYVEQLQGIEAYMPLIAQIGQYATIVVMALSGSRTTQIIAQAKREEKK